MVIGTRSAVFAPVDRLGLVAVWDGDEPGRTACPYLHARRVAMLRAHQLRCAAMIGGTPARPGSGAGAQWLGS